MRTLTTHLTKNVGIAATDQPHVTNGACHEYAIEIKDDKQSKVIPISCQNGPSKEFGVNGIPDEALYAILIDRLQGFQKGQFKCRENALALTELETSLMWLQKRTRDREARGVEGTNAI